MDCLFCKIINGEIPAYIIYEDELTKVFLDTHPDVNGHMLIVPKKHIVDLNDLDDATAIATMNTAKKIHQLLTEKLHISGLTLIQNNGDTQQIKHFHLHLKPHYDELNEIKEIEEIYNTLKK